MLVMDRKCFVRDGVFSLSWARALSSQWSDAHPTRTSIFIHIDVYFSLDEHDLDPEDFFLRR